MKDNGSIKDKIYETRRRKGISQEEMANKLGMSLNSYRKIERGPTLLVSRRIWEIAKTLGVTPEELVMDDDFESGMSLPDIERKTYENNIQSLKDEIAALMQCIDILNEKNSSYTKKAK